MNLEGLYSRTRVAFDPQLRHDLFTLNGLSVDGVALQRLSALLDKVRQLAGILIYAQVESRNNFPTGAGLASSASGFAALTLAACGAAGLKPGEGDLSRLARLASGSACRSVPGGFVEWQVGEDHQSSYAFSIAPLQHWDLVDCIAVISQAHKPTSSQEGHALADTSPLQAARLADAPRRLDLCRRAILERDFDALAEVAELDSNLMHAVIITSTPAVFYWHPTTLTVMQAVSNWRKNGLPACYTIDAGPNVHVICLSDWVGQVSERLRQIPGVTEVLTARPGGPARLIPEFEGEMTS